MNPFTAFASSIATFFTGEFAKCIVIEPVKRHSGYVLDRKKNLKEFRKKIELMEDKRERVKNDVEAAKRKGEKVEKDVRKWLISVDQKIKEEAEEVKGLEDKAKKKCFMGLCPNLMSYYQLGKKAEENAKVVDELLEQARFDRVSYRPPPEGVGARPFKDYEAFESRAGTLEGIMEALRNPNVRTVGAYGMAGVGKSKLVLEVARKAREECLFDEVVMAAVSPKPNIRNIQGEIADAMGFRFDVESDSGRKEQLRQVFQFKVREENRKILVILDDIWVNIDLDAIGIWFEEDDDKIGGNKKQGSIMQDIGQSSPKKFSTGSKVLLISRDKNVLGLMYSEIRMFEVRILSEDEAMNWFRKIVGDILEEPGYRPIAKKVLERCGGLPLAISVIANALRTKRAINIWEDILRQLQRPKSANFKGMTEGVYSVIKSSYESCGNQEVQSLLQLISWAPQGFRIYVPYLLRSCLGLDLLEGVTTLKEARNSLEALLDNLKSSSLLLDGDYNEYMKMHDLIRDVCIFLTPEEIVTDEAHLIELLKREKLKNCKAISLRYGSEIYELPMLDCPNLKFLALLNENPLSKISEDFFQEMKDLKVLQFIGMSFSSLPTSLVSLTNLQTLFLSDCKLNDIAIIGELKRLDILTIDDCHIEHLPREISQLSQLRLLDLGDCPKLVRIPENVIASLTCLEELFMGNSFNRWNVEGNARLAELKSLCRLTCLDVHIRDAQILRRCLLSEKLERYKIFIGDVWDWSEELGYSRALKLRLLDESFNLDQALVTLLKKTEALYVDELKGISGSLDKLDKEGFPNLKSLHVQNNPGIQRIVADSVHRIAFPILECLFLHSLINLKKICGVVGVGSFAGLRIIKVERCNRLKNLFSSNSTIQLSQLQEIEVMDCRSMVEVVAAEREQNSEASNNIDEITAETEQNNEASIGIGLGQLRSLILQRLPELVSFCSEEEDSTAQSVEERYRSSNSFPLFSEKMVFSSLEKLRLSSINIENIWHDQLSKNCSSCVHNLTSLIIEKCDNLKHLLSSSIARSFVHLKYFEIINCKCLIDIISAEDIEDIQDKPTISFPQLNSLKMKDLPCLLGFFSGNNIVEFPSLKLLEIDNCLELKGFMHNSTIQENSLISTQALFNEKVTFPSLEQMTISHLRRMKMLWHNNLFTNSFSKLEEMTVQNCDKLQSIFPSNMLVKFPRLQSLTVSSCVSLKEVFNLQTLSVGETSVTCKLRELYTFHLPRLNYIWSKDSQGRATFTFENLSVLQIGDCWSLKNVLPASIAKGLQQLKDLEISHSGVEEIVSMDEGSETDITFEFDEVSTFVLWNLPKLQCFYPGKHKTTWRQIKELKVYHYNKLKIFGSEHISLSDMNEDSKVTSPMQQPLFWVEKVIPKLEELTLNGNDIAVIGKNQVSGSLFEDIKVLGVLCYHDESSTFPISFLERFYSLQRLEVICCSFRELFFHKGDIADKMHIPTFSKVRYLKLALLDNLQHVWDQDSRIDHILPNLEHLEIVRCRSLINLGLSSASFLKLKTLDVFGCEALRNLVPSSAVQSLVHLEKMLVTECISMKEVVGSEGDEETNIITFSKLKCLELQHLPNLASFSSSNRTFEFQSMEQVIVSQCPELKTFSVGALNVPMLRRIQLTGDDYKECWGGDLNSTIQQLYTEKVGYQGMEYLVLSNFSTSIEIWNQNLQRSLDFKRLKRLIIHDCVGLKFLFSVSMALDLLQLEDISVKNCPMMEQIVLTDGSLEGRAAETIMLPWLKFITLESCSRLTSFYLGTITMECPLLKEIFVADCPKMFAFASAFSREHDFETVGGGSINRLGTAHFFSDQVAFPNMEKITISDLRSVKRIWSDHLYFDSFCKLKELKVEYCDELLNIFPSLGVFQSLEILKVTDCGSLEEVFDIKETWDMAIQLRELYLYRLPKLKHVWNKDPHGSISIQNLRVVNVFNCWSLTSLFPFSIAKGLRQLKSLTVNNSGVEEVISPNNGGLEQETQFEFNRLSFLMLWMLPELKWFYRGMHTTAWPALKRLRTYLCEKIDIFGPLASQIQQPIFLINKVIIAQLEEVSFSSDDIVKICNGHLIADSFSNIKVLRITCYLTESALIPLYFLQKFNNLERLEVVDCNFEELFLYQGNINGEEKQVWTLPKVRELRLGGFSKLGHLWKKDSPLDQICASLETLEFFRRPSLINFVSSSESFQNLTTLDVWECERITELVTFSNAQNLVSLVTMKIEECGMMKEVIASEGDDEAKYEIIFKKLKRLELHCLPRLESFCSGNYSYKFPSLEQVIVGQCPRLKSFCHGYLSTPKLRRVQLKETDTTRRWAGNLNATVEQLHKEKVGYNGIKHLKFLEFPELVDIWVRNPREVPELNNLEFLEVCDSNNLKCIFNLSMALRLGRLQQLEIKRCKKMEAVIKEEEATTTTDDKIIIFPILKSIIIESCPDLTSFYLGSSYLLEFPSLKKIKVSYCPNMTAFVSTLSRAKDKQATIADEIERNENVLTTFFCYKVVLPRLEELELASIEIQKTWDDQSHAQSLRSLTVKGCHNLKSIFSSSMIECLAQLEELAIRNCENLKEVFSVVVEAEGMSPILFPKLKTLVLEDLPGLERFCFGNFFEFPYLHRLWIKNCIALNTFISDFAIEDENQIGQQADLRSTKVVSESLFNKKVAFPLLMDLEIIGMGNWRKIWHNQLAEDSFGILTFLLVESCERLLNVFPRNVAQQLDGLVAMNIGNCGSLEEIVEAQCIGASELCGSETDINFVFPKLIFLGLHMLPKLRSFYSGKHTTEWPSLKEMWVGGCDNMEIFASESLISGESTSQQPLFWVNEATFPSLVELKLVRNDIMKEIWRGQLQAEIFPKLKVLELIKFIEVSAALLHRLFQSLPNLEKLVVNDAPLNHIFQWEALVGERQVLAMSQLSELKLTKLPELTHIWKEESLPTIVLCNLRTLEVHECDRLMNLVPSSVSFANLATLEVLECHGIGNLMSCSTAKSLMQLTNISVIDCEMIEEIIACKCDELIGCIVFPQLKILRLSCLSALECFCLGDHIFDFPALEKLTVKGCPKMEKFCPGDLNTPNLQLVESTDNEDGEIRHCNGKLNACIQQLFNERVGYNGIKHLKFLQFPELVDLWIRNPREVPEFKNLEFLEVCDSNILKCIFNLSMTTSLGRLQQLEIKRCKKMEAVIKEEEATTPTTDDKIIIFPLLKSIIIESCPDLISFYLGSSYLVEFPSMKKIKVSYSPNMTAFVSTLSRAKDKQATIADEIERNSNVLTAFFCYKVVLPRLEELELASIEIQKIWDDQSHAQSLRSLTVKGCHNLKSIFSSSMIECFAQLEELAIGNCENLKEVFSIVVEAEGMSPILFPKLETLVLEDLPGLERFCFGNFFEFPNLHLLWIQKCIALNMFISDFAREDENQIGQQVDLRRTKVVSESLFNKKVAFPLLKKLAIIGMGNWRKIWHDQLAEDSFGKLTFLLVKSCERLLNVFPRNVVRRLEGLMAMNIENCGSLEEIVKAECIGASELCGSETAINFVFPNLVFLRLHTLPKLRSFYSGNHTTDWPSLKEMWVCGCDNMEIFASKSLTSGESTSQQPLFWVNEATFPSLEELKLERNDIMKEIWRGQLQAEFFPKLKVLELIKFIEVSAAFLHRLFQSLPNLEKLVVNDAPLNHIFQWEELVEERRVSAMSQLSELKLTKLPELTHIWKEESIPTTVLCNLRTLEVHECDRLMNLVPFSVSFANLATLEVLECHGIGNLMSCSTAKSMMQLTNISVIDCEMIEEIIACKCDELKGCIVFTQLKILRLSCLSALESFCLGDHIFDFPALEKLTVKGCPKMEKFCPGDVNTPNLQRVELTDDEDGEIRHCNGNLNACIQQLFNERNVKNSEESTMVTLN